MPLPVDRGEIYTLTEAAKYLGFSKQYLSKLENLGKGPPRLVIKNTYNDRIFFAKDDLDYWKSTRVFLGHSPKGQYYPN